MTRIFLSTEEVAELFHVKPKTLVNYGCRHDVYKPDHPGVFHVEHVKILEKVWLKVLTPDDGLDLWEYHKQYMRRSALGVLDRIGKTKSLRKNRKANQASS